MADEVCGPDIPAIVEDIRALLRESKWQSDTICRLRAEVDALKRGKARLARRHADALEQIDILEEQLATANGLLDEYATQCEALEDRLAALAG